jgi:hypothetical protein
LQHDASTKHDSKSHTAPLAQQMDVVRNCLQELKRVDTITDVSQRIPARKTLLADLVKARGMASLDQVTLAAEDVIPSQ